MKAKKFNVNHTNELCSSMKQLKNPILLLARLEIAESARVKAVNLRKIPAQLGKGALDLFYFSLALGECYVNRSGLEPEPLVFPHCYAINFTPTLFASPHFVNFLIKQFRNVWR